MLLRTLAFTAIAPFVLTATDASATAQRTFVASYGSPANTAFNCSIVKPCRAFSEAISVTSPAGEVIVLDSAGYGSVTITQSVSIIAPPGIYAGVSVSGGNDGVTINAPGAIVVLRGLSINGQGGLRGILFQAGARLRVENCVLSGMSSAGISHSAPSGELIVLASITRDNGGTGINVNGDILSAVLDHVQSEHNQGDGFYLAPTAGSVGALATVVESVFTHNGGNGIAAESIAGATVTIVVDRSVMASNGLSGFRTDVPTGSSVTATVSHSTLNDNGISGLHITGSGNIVAGAVENVAHRNSYAGIWFTNPISNNIKAYAKGNTALGNLGFDLVCNYGVLYTDGLNLSNGSQNNFDGCTITNSLK